MDSKLINGQFQKLFPLAKGPQSKILLCLKQQTEEQNIESENLNPNNQRISNLPIQQYSVLKKLQIPSDDDKATRKLRELEILQKLNHPNILKIKGTFETIKEYVCQKIRQVYMEMDYYRDITQIKLANYTIQQKGLMIYQIAKAVDYMHQNQIIHRDLKPKNIFLNHDGQILLGDFGISIYKDQKLEDIQIALTKGYQPIEIIYGEKQINFSSDIWSLGVTFMEIMNNGEKLFDSYCDFEMLSQIFKLLGTPQSQNWESCKNLPNYIEIEVQNEIIQINQFQDKCGFDPSFIDLIKQMLALDPLKRPDSQQVLQHPYFKQFENKNDQQVSKQNQEMANRVYSSLKVEKRQIVSK